MKYKDKDKGIEDDENIYESHIQYVACLYFIFVSLTTHTKTDHLSYRLNAFALNIDQRL